MADQYTEQLHELPLIKLSSLVSSLPAVLSNAFKPNTANSEQHVYKKAQCQVDCFPAKVRDSAAGHVSGVLHTVTQAHLSEALADEDPVASWEPTNWKHIKALAPAAGDEGVVELMRSQEHMGQHVAVKRLPRELLRSSPQEFKEYYPDAVEHPWTDIAMVKHLNSLCFSYVCQFLGVFIGHNQVYVVTSFANQGDLLSWWREDKSEAGMAREAVMHPIVSQMFDGICWLHNLGIAHRDLSLENVLLHDTGNGLQVKIVDFAMASLSRRATREVRGKRSYQAPEMHEPGEYDLFLADNFAAGVIIYCMAVHRYPWEHTKPGKDANFEFVRRRGLEIFLQRTLMPCTMRSVAEIFTHSFLEMLCGLLAFAPDMRYSLGEASLEEDVFIASSHRPSFSSDVDAASDLSTTDSLDNICRDAHMHCFKFDYNVDNEASHCSLSRMSVWRCQWLSKE